MPHSFDKWRERLTDAKRVWIDKGILGTSADSTMRMLIEFYRSNQWQGMEHWGGLQTEALRIVNKIFPMANAMQAEIAARNPKTQYFARHEDWTVAAPKVKALHDYDIREQNHQRQLNAAFRDHQLAPFGIIRHGFTPEEEYETEGSTRRRKRRMQLYRPANPNRPWLRRISPWNVLMDPYCEAFHPDGGMRWCAFRDVMMKRDIADNPNMTVDRKKLQGSSGNIASEWLEMQDPALRQSGSPDKAEGFEVWTVYEAEEGQWFQMALSGIDDWLRKPADWPIPWETLPINIFSVNEQMDTPFSLALLEDQIPLQNELNQVRTMLSQGVLRGRSFNIANAQSFEDDEVTRMKDGEMGEWFFAKGGDLGNAVQSVKTTGVSQESLLLLGIVTDDMRESGGQSKMQRGQRINVSSATEASFVQSGNDINAGRIEDSFVTFVTEVESTYMQGRRFILGEVGESERVRILGTSGSAQLDQWVDVTPEDLAGDYAFELEAGSTRRRNKAQESQEAAVDLEIASKMPPQVANIPYFFKRYLEARDIPTSEGMMREAGQAGQQDAQVEARNRALGQGGQTGGLDANVIAAMNGAGRSQ